MQSLRNMILEVHWVSPDTHYVIIMYAISIFLFALLDLIPFNRVFAGFTEWNCYT